MEDYNENARDFFENLGEMTESPPKLDEETKQIMMSEEFIQLQRENGITNNSDMEELMAWRTNPFKMIHDICNGSSCSYCQFMYVCKPDYGESNYHVPEKWDW